MIYVQLREAIVMAENMVLLWSGGKDSALTLNEIKRCGEYEVVTLLTTVTEGYDRVSMHGVRRPLLELQAMSLGLPLKQALIPQNCSNEEYASRMSRACDELKDAGLHTVASSDIFLEDVRRYREERFEEAGMKGVFPLWGRDSSELALAFIEEGFEAVTVCVDSQVLGKEWAGRNFDTRFLDDLPSSVDPCGENGEFHTFVYNGPIFRQSVPWARGEVVLRDDRFYYCDLLPA